MTNKKFCVENIFFLKPTQQYLSQVKLVQDHQFYPLYQGILVNTINFSNQTYIYTVVKIRQ